MKLSNVNLKRQTKRLLEVNERTMLMALESQLDVELNVLSDLLTVASRSVDRINFIEVIESLRLDIEESNTVMSQLKSAILEIKDNDPTAKSKLKSAILEIKDNDPTAKSKLTSDVADKIFSNFAADDIPF